jgi:hypothetical protein
MAGRGRRAAGVGDEGDFGYQQIGDGARFNDGALRIDGLAGEDFMHAHGDEFLCPKRGDDFPRYLSPRTV